jgi:hypothetical protein
MCNIIKLFFFGDYIRFGFELINKKMFEMKMKKMDHLISLVIFHLIMIISQNLHLPHTYGNHLNEKHQFMK